MKRTLISTAFLLAAVLAAPRLSAQKRMGVGDKTPELRIARWIVGTAPAPGEAVYLDFFTSSNPRAREELSVLEGYALHYRGRIAFVVVTRDDPGETAAYFRGMNPSYAVGIDEEGKTFSGFGVLYVPFGVLIDAKGRFVWQGRTSRLTDEVLREAVR